MDRSHGEPFNSLLDGLPSSFSRVAGAIEIKVHNLLASGAPRGVLKVDKLIDSHVKLLNVKAADRSNLLYKKDSSSLIKLCKRKCIGSPKRQCCQHSLKALDQDLAKVNK